MAKTFIVQYRETVGAALQLHGEFQARNGAGAIAQSARIIGQWGCECIEIVATQKNAIETVTYNIEVTDTYGG